MSISFDSLQNQYSQNYNLLPAKSSSDPAISGIPLDNVQKVTPDTIIQMIKKIFFMIILRN